MACWGKCPVVLNQPRARYFQHACDPWATWWFHSCMDQVYCIRQAAHCPAALKSNLQSSYQVGSPGVDCACIGEVFRSHTKALLDQTQLCLDIFYPFFNLFTYLTHKANGRIPWTQVSGSYLSRIFQEPWLANALEGRIKDEEIVYLKLMLCLMDNIFMGFFPQKLNDMNKS